VVTYTILPTRKFKQQFKNVQKTPRWNRVFSGTAPLAGENRPAWDIVISCLLSGTPIPSYFYPHRLHGKQQLAKQIMFLLSKQHISVSIMECHLDGKNGDHLLIYTILPETNQVFSISIDTHAELF